jgi:ribosome-associated protein
MPKTPRKKLATEKRPPAKRRPAAKKKRAAKKKVSVLKQRNITALVTDALADMKALQVHTVDVRHLTSVTDTMIFASGRSDRHVRALADAVVERCKQAGVAPLGVEGKDAGEWVLVDLADVVVHVMLPRVRDFYNLEKLWDISARDEALEH